MVQSCIPERSSHAQVVLLRPQTGNYLVSLETGGRTCALWLALAKKLPLPILYLLHPIGVCELCVYGPTGVASEVSFLISSENSIDLTDFGSQSKFQSRES